MANEIREEGVEEIAIIGMAARLPGAENIAAFWENLRRGVDSVSFFSDEELAHVPQEDLAKPNYVNAGAVLDHIDRFDAAFFAITPGEAAIMDPQQRFFLECSWHALENAGFTPEEVQAAGVFAGTGGAYYLNQLLRDPNLLASVGEMALGIGNSADHFATRVSYLMNLRGPAVTVQTACSTSLVAVHLACQSLLAYECDMALAGGCSLTTKSGYLYMEDGILSPDGHCRVFDAEAKGTVRGSGVGVVVLKRLGEALAGRDTIHAVIKGSAVNNDGAAKMGYTAPSVEGQRRVIQEALAVAGVAPETLSYVEAHGTGTAVGDPIEVEALTQAFGDAGGKQFCALGSVKSNIGHCDAAAGIAGLLKTVLCLAHRTLVPSLHYRQPNPRIAFEKTPFYVNTQTRSWPGEQLRAAVSSFGIGGTNAHVILERAPAQPGTAVDVDLDILTLSAKSASALAAQRANLAAFLDSREDLSLANVAYTFNLGRKSLAFRHALVFGDRESLLHGLSREWPAAVTPAGKPRVIFLLPGQGKVFADMGRELYQWEPRFGETVDRCCSLLQPHMELDLAAHLFAPEGSEARERLLRPALWQPAQFAITYALAEWWRGLGVQPAALMGHSIGEVVAAVLAGVLRLEDGLDLVAWRGRAMEDLPPGAMLAVLQSEEGVQSYLTEELSLAAVNGPRLCVVSGPIPRVEELAVTLQKQKIRTIRLETTLAFHSDMVAPVAARMAERAAGFQCKPPQTPLVSNVTGTWLTEVEAGDAGYWARHLRATVRFNQGLEVLIGEPDILFLEVGPGDTLAGLVRHHPQCREIPVIAPEGGALTRETLWNMLASIWERGVAIDWSAFYGEEPRRRIPLPGYPFERKSFWIENAVAEAVPTADALTVKRDPAEWFYLPCWKQAPLLLSARWDKHLEPGMRWLIFLDRTGVGERLAQNLERREQDVVRVVAGDGFVREGEGFFRVKFQSHEALTSLMKALAEEKRIPKHILHAGEISGDSSDQPATAAYDELILLAQTLALQHFSGKLTVLTAGMQPVRDTEKGQVARSALLGALRVIPTELPGVTCKSIDLENGSPGDAVLDGILAELSGDDPAQTVAWRGRMRWIEDFEPLKPGPEAPVHSFRKKGVFLIINGLQEIGLSLAEHLLARTKGRVILLDRSFFPGREDWDGWLRDQGKEDPISRHISRIRALPAHQIRVVTANPAENGVLEALREKEPITGIFYLDQLTEGALIQTKDPHHPSTLLADKNAELDRLEALANEVDFMVLFAENPGEGGIGHVEQAAVYEVTDHFAHQLAACGVATVTCVDWGTRRWEDDPKAVQADPVQRQLHEKRRRFGMTQTECMAALERMVTWQLPRIIVSTRAYGAVLEQQRMFTASYFQDQFQKMAGSGKQPRPDLASAYAPAESETEKTLVAQWEYYFGIDKIGIQDSFFELGGHSLLAVQMLNKVSELFGVEIPVQQLFDASTISELAVIIDRDHKPALGEDDMARLLEEIEGLSEQEALAAIEAESQS